MRRMALAGPCFIPPSSPMTPLRIAAITCGASPSRVRLWSPPQSHVAPVMRPVALHLLSVPLSANVKARTALGRPLDARFVD
jgi:hypothetical protein